MLRLLGRPNSINVQKVMWCCAELDVAVDRVDVGGPFGGNDTPEYLAKNPTGLIPTLEDGDLTIWESNSIVRHLAATRGAAPWWPDDAAGRALANQWMDFYLTSVHPPMTQIFLGLVRQSAEERDAATIERARERVAGYWRLVDGQLSGRPYLGGEAPCIGDIPLGCAAYRWYALDVERPDLPNLEAWAGRLAARPAYRQHVMLPLT
jgi:glutathione S-transferase